MKVNTTPKRFLSVRLTPEELEEVKQLSESSSCRSLTEYVKKVLMKKPVSVKVRNQSQEELREVFIGIKNRLDQFEDRAQDGEQTRDLREIKSMMRQIHERVIGD